MTLGSGDYEDYIYDHLDRLISVKYNNVVTYTLTYDANGQIAKCVDAKANVTHAYEYDGLGRLIRAWQANSSGDKTLAVENLYDQYGRADKSTYVIGDKTLTYDVSYKADTNLVSSVLMPTTTFGSAINYTYDGLERLTKKNISFSTLHDIYEEYSYYGHTSGGVQYTTPLVSTLTLKKDSTTTATYSYTYDSLGNITQVRENGVLKLSYEYDSLNQLVRENNAYANKTWKYVYDKSGNIVYKDEYAYTTGTLPASPQSFVFYDYSTGTWGDMLTSYNGTTITYDAIGNPTNWRNALGLTWSGKQLTYIAIDGLDEGLGASYNADGIRTKKTYWDENANQTVHDYVLDGSKIVKETVTGSSSYTMYYYYDAAGSIAGFEYNGSPYYYQKNLQGDIIRICNLGGDTIVQYTYDAWGNILSITGSQASTLGQINPFRYRGYYYDTETGLYYLQTRYYDPQVGRFLNADEFDFLGVDGSILSYNLFVYCLNNPLNRFDESGNWSWSNLFKVVVGVVAAVAAVAITVATAGTGAAAIVPAVVSVAKTVAISTVTSAAVRATVHVATTKSFDGIGQAICDGAADGFMWGGLSALGGATINALQNAGKIPKRVKISQLVNNPSDEFTTIGPKQGEIANKIAQIQRTGCYEKPYVKALTDGLYEIQNGHHTVQALKSLGKTSVKVFITK